MSENRADYQPKQDSVSQVAGKLKRLAILQLDTGFNPQAAPLHYPKQAFTGLLNPSDRVETAAFPTRPGSTDRVERSIAKQRADTMFSFLSELHPTQKELDQISDTDGMQRLFEDPTKVQDFRLTDFLLDERIATVWMRLPEDSFREFIRLAREGELPSSFTSENEMERLHITHGEGLRAEVREDENNLGMLEGSMDQAGTNLVSESARQVFYELAVEDPGENKNLKKDFDLDAALNEVQTRFPQ